MATRNEQFADILDRYLDEVNPDPVSLDEVAEWALSEGLFRPEPRDLKKDMPRRNRTRRASAEAV